MSKYLRLRNVSRDLDEPKEIKEEFDEFLTEVTEAGQLLRELREKRGLSEKELGQKIGIEGDEIRRMEQGEQPIPLNAAKNFGKLFNVDHHLFL
jgi:ribosome-binding protein aMBF1 (putative translation factor)